MNSNENHKEQANDFLESLMKVEKRAISGDRRELIKKNILFQINLPVEQRQTLSVFSVINYIRELGNTVLINENRRTTIREKVLSFIEDNPRQRKMWSNFFVFHKKFVSATLLVVMFFGMFAFVNVDTNIVRAQTFTVLDDYRGEVSVERNGERLSISKGMQIYEEDMVKTGNDGFVAIKYFDDSINRLATNTQVVITQLEKANDNYVQSRVEVSLIEGKLWSKVLNLVGKESSFIVVANDVSAMAQKAAFNVVCDDEKVEVEVFNRSVEVKKEDKVNNVMSGKKAVVDYEFEVQDIVDEEQTDEWIVNNLTDDEKYVVEVEERLLAARMQSIGLKEGSEVNLDDSLREKAAVLLTFDDVERTMKKLDLIEKKMIAAEASLNSSDISEKNLSDLQGVIDEFSGNINNFYILIKEVSYTDKEYSDELKNFVDNKLLAMKKSYGLALPDQPMYEFKELVDDLLISGAEDQYEVAELKIQKNIDRLDDDKSELALDAIKNDMTDVIDVIQNIETENFIEREKLLVKTNEFFELLNDDESSLIGDEQSALHKDFEKLHSIVKNIQHPDDLQSNPDANEIATDDVVISAPAIVPVEVEPTVVEEKYGVNVEDSKPLPVGL